MLEPNQINKLDNAQWYTMTTVLDMQKAFLERFTEGLNRSVDLFAKSYELNPFAAMLKPPADRKPLFSVPAKTTTVAQEEHVVDLGDEVLDIKVKPVHGSETRVRRILKTIPVERHVELNDSTVVVKRIVATGVIPEEALSDEEYVLVDVREVPEVSKRYKLRERVVVRHERVARVETVRDTLRHTDIEIDQNSRLPVVQAARELVKHVTEVREAYDEDLKNRDASNSEQGRKDTQINKPVEVKGNPGPNTVG